MRQSSCGDVESCPDLRVSDGGASIEFFFYWAEGGKGCGGNPLWLVVASLALLPAI